MQGLAVFTRVDMVVAQAEVGEGEIIPYLSERYGKQVV